MHGAHRNGAGVLSPQSRAIRRKGAFRYVAFEV
ncbi:hypothetical protein Tcur_1615 [Thermomonospora curvata DSM 43183]|uniref:Uncharacterized protein n=1 Tax=Thermomonospora curvata (strain ATCC 19995 / DSM 43183 / JCM 3096 / KCTC 9072 / NBRC 15933 / NCIMB 10081 / Henssen B9) TaxID=471852 RepID=D1ABF5_THECD|nr:hypothetical protein Tcur_1615 [Thermomonospora curvata DSM 43183]